jgi:hypothetical protein
MKGVVVVTVLGALGFVLGYFYTRTVRLAARLPEEYMSKSQCSMDRDLCRHYQNRERDELLTRIERIEEKLDRLIERLISG